MQKPKTTPNTKEIKDRFIIKVFKLTECFQQKKYFSELYRKNVGEFK
jgi:hypothetical protein